MPVSTTSYVYNWAGNVTEVRTVMDNVFTTPKYRAHRLEYARNGRAVTYVWGEVWDGFDALGNKTNWEITYAREFRYGERSERERAATGKAGRRPASGPRAFPEGTSMMRVTGGGARQRYLVRELDLLAMTNSQYTPVADVFTDYDGDEPYGDFTVTPGSPPTVATESENVVTWLMNRTLAQRLAYGTWCAVVVFVALAGFFEPASDRWESVLFQVVVWMGDRGFPALAITIVARMGLALAYLLPLLGALLVFYKLVGHTCADGHTRCGKCAQILKGLAEPRCPKCGQEI